MRPLLALSLAVLGGAAPVNAQNEAAPAGGDKGPLVLEEHVKNEGVFAFDYGVPTSPALVLAGLSGDKTTVNSASLKPFVLSLPSVLSGTEGQSVALDIAPAALAGGDRQQTYDDYVTGSRLGRIAVRSRLNVAIYNGVDGGGDASKDKASRLALGASFSLLDNNDPLMAGSRPGKDSVWLDCLKKAQPIIDRLHTLSFMPPPLIELQQLQTDAQSGSIPGRTMPNFTADQVALIEKTVGHPMNLTGQTALDKPKLGAIARELQKTIGPLREEAEKAFVTRPEADAAREVEESCAQKAANAAAKGAALNIGGGVLWRGKPGALDELKNGGAVIWASGHVSVFRFPGEEKDGSRDSFFMLGGYARIGRAERIATGDKTTPEIRADTQEYWGGGEYYSSSFKLVGQIGWSKTEARDPALSSFSSSGDRYLISGAVPFRTVAEGLWLGFSYGDARGTVETRQGHVFRLTIDFGPPKPANIFQGKK